MSREIKKHKYWLMPACVLLAGCAMLLGWQQIHAQETPPPVVVEGPPPGATPAPSTPSAPVTAATPAPGASAAAMPKPTPPEPTFGIGSVASGIKLIRIKNWDGKFTEMLRFKYKTMSGRVITIHLPAVYKSDKRTKAGWDTLFACYSMDYEAMLDQMERNRPPDLSAYMGQLMAEIRGEVPEGTFEQQTQGTQQAMDVAQHYLSGMGVGDLSLPPLLPGMP